MSNKMLSMLSLSGADRCRGCALARREGLALVMPRWGCVAAILLLLSPRQASCADTYWNVASGDWSGAANWSGAEPTSSTNAYIYNDGTASVTQSGEVCSGLYLGDSGAGKSGTVEMTGGGLSAGSQNVGYSGTGNFSQSGGTNTASSNLYLGCNSESSGTYNLSGTGQLSTRREYVGYSGTGTFIQSGGTNTVNYYAGNPYYLYLGYNAGSSGTYNLSGTGQLIAQQEYVGYDAGATAVFHQAGGSNATAYVSVGSGGTYTLTGGTLNITGSYCGIASQGTIDCTNSQATLLVGSNSIVDFSRANLTNVGGMTVQIGANSLLTVPAGFDASTAFGTFAADASSIIHTAGTAVVVPAGRTIGGQGSINDLVNCEGTIATGGWALNLNNGLILSAGGNVNLSHGNLTVNDGTSGITGGTLGVVGNGYIGRGGIGVFTQSGGDYSTPHGNIFLGYNSGDGGTYKLSGGTLYNEYAYIGYSGTGDFIQSGGTNTAIHGFSLGYNSGSSGDYTLSAGTLHTQGEYVGYSGTGTFTQSGGANTFSGGGGLCLGRNAGSNGTYSLNDGQIITNNLCVGSSGTGTFNQAGGTVTMSSFSLGANTGSNGTYNLSAGQFSSPTEKLGGDPGGTARFHQTGGTNTTTTIMSIGSQGRYELHGGTLQVNGGILNSGVFDGGNSPATFVANCLVDLSSGTWQNLRSTTFKMGSNSLFIIPPGFNPATDVAGDSTFNLIHTVGTTLAVPGGQGFGGSGTINDPVECQGTISAASGGAISLTSTLTVSGNGSLSLGNGNVTTNDTTSAMRGGSLTAQYHYVGNGGAGLFTQDGGVESSSDVDVAHGAGDSGEYRLISGTVHPSFLYVGSAGKGLFTHSGGASSPSYAYIGKETGGDGTYSLGGSGQFTAWMQYVGYDGSGSVLQTGGTNTIRSGNGGLYVGYRSGGIGNYELREGGTLSVNGHTYVGYQGRGAFLQTGGTHTVIWPVGWSGSQMADLFIGYATGSSGSYTLAGGLLSMTSNAYEYVGYQGTGEFTQTGGTNTLATSCCLEIGCYSGSTGTYNLGGSGLLSAPAEFVGYTTTGTFNQSGGTNSAAAITLAYSAGSSGTYNLNGGVLNAAALSGGAGTAVFNFGGGTLQAGGALSTSLPMILTGVGGNAKVDTAGYAVTLSGQLSGQGGLNKLGSNTLTLSAANTFSGGTTINIGTLAAAADDALGSGNIAVAPGAMLDLSSLSLTTGAIADTAAITLGFDGVASYGKVVFGTSTLDEIVGSLILGTTTMPPGTYGSSSSAAQFRYDTYFSGSGLITVVPEPSTLVLLGVGSLGLLAYAWRRRKR